MTATQDSFAEQKKSRVGIDTAQILKRWSNDLNFFRHGSMSTEGMPESVLRAFIQIYPDLFPARAPYSFLLVIVIGLPL